jgi:hypothetical protein
MEKAWKNALKRANKKCPSYFWMKEFCQDEIHWGDRVSSIYNCPHHDFAAS